jgi:amphiphysin
LEQEFEIASNDYTNINEALKTELPQFMTLVTRFMDPLFQSFFYMQLNIYYLILEKMQGFADGKYDISLKYGEITTSYEDRKGDAQEKVDNMHIVKKIISVCT